AWGLTQAEVRQVDTNRNRKLGDILAVDQYPNANELAALVKAAIAWDHGAYLAPGHYRPSPAQVEELLKTDLDELQAAIRRAKSVSARHRGKFVPSMLAVFAYQVTKIDAEAADWFLDQMVSLNDP